MLFALSLLSEFCGFCGASSAFALSVTFVFMAFWLLFFFGCCGLILAILTTELSGLPRPHSAAVS